MPPPADMTKWLGGLSGGPVVLFDDTSSQSRVRSTGQVMRTTVGGGSDDPSSSSSARRSRGVAPLTCVVIGTSSEFTTGILSRAGNRLVAGVQGMVSDGGGAAECFGVCVCVCVCVCV